MSAIKPVAVVTGASYGIGRALAIKLSEMGYNVILLARNESKLEETGKLCKAANSRISTKIMTCDLSSNDGLSEFESKLDKILNVDKFGDLFVLINNAGLNEPSHADRCNWPVWNKTINVNLVAAMSTCKYCLPYLKNSINKVTKLGNSDNFELGNGIGIINIGSVASTKMFTTIGESAYIASKYGLLGFSQGLFYDIRHHGIKVSYLMPGYVDTPLLRQFAKQYDYVNVNNAMNTRDFGHAVEYILKCSKKCCPRELLIDNQFDIVKSKL